MLDRLYILVEMLAITLGLHQLYGKKYVFDYKTMILFSVDLLIIQAINDNYLPQLATLIVYPIICCYCMWKFGNGIKVALINTVICVVVLSFFQIIAFSCVGRLASFGIGEEVILILTNIIVVLVLLVLSKRKLLYNISRFLQRKDVILSFVLISGVIGITICAIAVRENFGLYQGQYLFLCVIIIILFLMAASWKMYKDRALENELELRAHKMYEKSYENLISEIRVKQHDIKNHINAIYLQHITYKTYDELIEAQKQACEEILVENKFTDLLAAGNPTVIGFLFSKFKEAVEKDIEIDYKVSFGELNMDMPIYELNTILGNLIDNAIEALEMSETKRIFVKVIEDETNLSIEVRNVNDVIELSKVQSMFKKGYSTKGGNRGLGLYSIKKIAKEYGFDIIFGNKTIDDKNWVSFEMIIKKRLLQ